jgi:hypothetical protein
VKVNRTSTGPKQGESTGHITNIEWADSTINPRTGCEGCELWGPRKRAELGQVAILWMSIYLMPNISA